MNKEVEDALHMLLHCSLKDTEYETQFEQFKIVYDYITNLEEELYKKNKKYWQQRCAYYNSILYLLKQWLNDRIKNVPETMCEVYEDERILNKIEELEEELKGETNEKDN